MGPLDYVVHETERQSGTMREALGMLRAYDMVYLRDGRKIDESFIKRLSAEITGNADYRRVPAVFNQGMPAVSSRVIPRLMPSLMLEFNEGPHETETLIKEFLDIHPFADGNGRVASLLFNWHRGSIGDPIPLPYFYGEKP